MLHTESFRAMDTDIDVIIEAEARPVAAFLSVRMLFEMQERRFSRFRPGSLLSRLNRGESIRDRHLERVCRLAIEGHARTGGLFNPMVLTALEGAGYDVTFSGVRGGSPRTMTIPDPADCLVIGGDEVSLRQGALDLGGIVKGWTADLGVELLRGEYEDVFINAGGDIRVAGAEPGADGWLVAVDSPLAGVPDPWEGALRGAVATSTTLKRRWRTADGGFAHHLIDPGTGMPARSPFAQVTAWAAEAWLAEVWSKAVLIGGESAAEAAVRAGHAIVAIGCDGTVLNREQSAVSGGSG